MDKDQLLEQAAELLADCARQLVRAGGQLNKDLARDATKLASVIADRTPEPKAA